MPHCIAFEMFKLYNFSYRECNKYAILYNMIKDKIETNTKYVCDSKHYLIAFEVIIPIILAFKVKDIVAYKECVLGHSNKLKEALYYVRNEFNKKDDYKNWLKDLVNYKDNDKNINEIDEIIEIYNKYRTYSWYSELFINCMNLNL